MESGRTHDENTPYHELRIIAQSKLDLIANIDAHRVIERDLADLAVERAEYGGPELPGTEPELQKLVARTGKALSGGPLAWWHRWRLRALKLPDREAIVELRDGAIVALRWQERLRAADARPAGVAESWRRLEDLTLSEQSAQLLKAQIARRVSGHEGLLRDRIEDMAAERPQSWSLMPKILKALPGWAVTNMSARVLPPRPAMFDLVIIDEAAQCTIPSVLPMLFRAKRALIIGDPRQLSPVIQLPEFDDRGQQTQAGIAYPWVNDRKLVYVRHSAYDAFAFAASQGHLLDQHYRCHPDIIDVPNRVVYQGRLTVLTSMGGLKATMEPACRWIDVPGYFERGATGSGQNKEEALTVVAEVGRLRQEFPDVTIGVVTPLAAQQRLLSGLLSRDGLGDSVKCATVHKFQGSECDIMVVSAAGATGIGEKTSGWLVGQTNLWNVAVTRAKSQLVVVGDKSWWSGQPGMLGALAQPASPSKSTPNGSVRSIDRVAMGLRTAGAAVTWDPSLPGNGLTCWSREIGGGWLCWRTIRVRTRTGGHYGGCWHSWNSLRRRRTCRFGGCLVAVPGGAGRGCPRDPARHLSWQPVTAGSIHI